MSPGIGENQWGSPSISYMGMDQKTKRWKRIETYGGKLVENCVQAIAVTVWRTPLNALRPLACR